MGLLVKRTGLSCTFLQRPPVTLRWAQTSSKQNTVNVSGQWFEIAAVTKAYLVQQQSMLYSATTCTNMLYIQYLWFSLVITSRTTLYLAPLKSRHFPRLLQGAAAIWLANTHGTLAKCLSVRNLLTGLSKASTWLQHCSLMVAVRLPCLPVFLEWFKAIVKVLGYHRTWIDMIILLCLTGTEWATCCYFANKALFVFRWSSCVPCDSMCVGPVAAIWCRKHAHVWYAGVVNALPPAGFLLANNFDLPCPSVRLQRRRRTLHRQNRKMDWSLGWPMLGSTGANDTCCLGSATNTSTSLSGQG